MKRFVNKLGLLLVVLIAGLSLSSCQAEKCNVCGGDGRQFDDIIGVNKGGIYCKKCKGDGQISFWDKIVNHFSHN